MVMLSADLIRPAASPFSFPSADLIRTKSLDKPHKFGSLQAVFPPDISKQITDWCIEQVPEYHLGKGGREYKIHLTIKYGFRGEISESIKQFLASYGPIPIRLTGLSQFKGNEDGDVLKIDVESEELHNLNAALTAAFATEEKYNSYISHITICYLDPKVSKFYEGIEAPFCNQSLLLTKLEWSPHDGETTPIPLGLLPMLGRFQSSPGPKTGRHAIDYSIASSQKIKALPSDSDPIQELVALAKQAKVRKESPDYGRLFYQPETGEVWYETADGDSREFTRWLFPELEKIVGNGKVKMEAESSPLQDEGWEQLFPERKGWNQKAMSWMAEGSGGALVPPPKFAGKLPLKRSSLVFDPEGLKEMRGRYRVKSNEEGKPCTTGHNAERDGCIPGSERRGDRKPMMEEGKGNRIVLSKPVKIERRGDFSSIRKGNRTSGVFFTEPGQSVSEYGEKVVEAELPVGTVLYNGDSTQAFAEENGLIDKKLAIVKKLTGKNTIREAEDYWLGLKLDKNGEAQNAYYNALQTVVAQKLKLMGFNGARWSNEDDLNPVQYQVWDEKLISIVSNADLQVPKTKPSPLEKSLSIPHVKEGFSGTRKDKLGHTNCYRNGIKVTCPRQASTQPERTRQDATQVIKQEVTKYALESLKKTGYVAKTTKEAAAEVANRIGQAVYDASPPKVQTGMAVTWKYAKMAEHAAMTFFRKGKELALEAAKERGATVETAEKVAQCLAIADLVMAWTINMPVTHAIAAPLGPVGSVVAAKVSSWLPLASFCYIGYSMSRNPFLTMRAAKRVMKGQNLTAHKSMPIFDYAQMEKRFKGYEPEPRLKPSHLEKQPQVYKPKTWPSPLEEGEDNDKDHIIAQILMELFGKNQLARMVGREGSKSLLWYVKAIKPAGPCAGKQGPCEAKDKRGHRICYNDGIRVMCQKQPKTTKQKTQGQQPVANQQVARQGQVAPTAEQQQQKPVKEPKPKKTPPPTYDEAKAKLEAVRGTQLDEPRVMAIFDGLRGMSIKDLRRLRDELGGATGGRSKEDVANKIRERLRGEQKPKEELNKEETQAVKDALEEDEGIDLALPEEVPTVELADEDNDQIELAPQEEKPAEVEPPKVAESPLEDRKLRDINDGLISEGDLRYAAEDEKAAENFRKFVRPEDQEAFDSKLEELRNQLELKKQSRYGKHKPLSREELKLRPKLKAFGDSLLVSDKEDPIVKRYLQDVELIPENIATSIRDMGGKLAIGKGYVSDFDVSKNSAFRDPPRGYPPGKGWDKVAGVYLGTEATAVAGSGRTGADSTALHEYGHMVGGLMGFDNSPELIDHHKRLYNKLSPYFQQGGPGAIAGRQELLAEGFAHVLLDKKKAAKRYDQEFVDWVEGILSGKAERASAGQASEADDEGVYLGELA